MARTAPHVSSEVKPRPVTWGLIEARKFRALPYGLSVRWGIRAAGGFALRRGGLPVRFRLFGSFGRSERQPFTGEPQPRNPGFHSAGSFCHPFAKFGLAAILVES